jgi:hypothetical protein
LHKEVRNDRQAQISPSVQGGNLTSQQPSAQPTGEEGAPEGGRGLSTTPNLLAPTVPVGTGPGGRGTEGGAGHTTTTQPGSNSEVGRPEGPNGNAPGETPGHGTGLPAQESPKGKPAGTGGALPGLFGQQPQGVSAELQPAPTGELSIATK